MEKCFIKYGGIDQKKNAPSQFLGKNGLYETFIFYPSLYLPTNSF